MAKSSKRGRTNITTKPQETQLQKGRQQGQNTGKEAWKSNFKQTDRQEGKLQAGQHPHKDEPFGSTPGEVRGNPGGKKGQAKSGQRGTKNTVKAKSKAKRAKKS